MVHMIKKRLVSRTGLSRTGLMVHMIKKDLSLGLDSLGLDSWYI